MNCAPLEQHQIEIERNKSCWDNKPLLQEIYSDFYHQIVSKLDHSIPGRIIELGSGIGNLKRHIPQALCTDLFPNPWLDLACDAYRLPFQNDSTSNVILFDVFHHLQRPFAFLLEARRVLAPGGRLILFEPFISLASSVAYGIFHHEPIGWSSPIDPTTEIPPQSGYYAAQGNATRLFFGKKPRIENFEILEANAFASFSYLLSGGLSKPALYPTGMLSFLKGLDAALSRFPRIFGARCLVVLRKPQQTV